MLHIVYKKLLIRNGVDHLNIQLFLMNSRRFNKVWQLGVRVPRSSRQQIAHPFRQQDPALFGWALAELEIVACYRFLFWPWLESLQLLPSLFLRHPSSAALPRTQSMACLSSRIPSRTWAAHGASSSGVYKSNSHYFVSSRGSWHGNRDQGGKSWTCELLMWRKSRQR